MTNALDSLKRVKEQLGKNYTSFQMLSVLDRLLWRAMSPIVETTDFFDRVLANVLGWGALNPRRKLSSLPKERFITYAMAYLAADSAQDKLRILRRLRLERNILFYTINQFISIASKTEPGNTDSRTYNALAAYKPERVWFAAREAQYWQDQALAFKGMILEKYMRFVMVEAQSFYKYQRQNNPHLTFELSEIAQNFVLVVNKAIDKCDAQKGTLTSHIQNWIKDAKGNPQLRGEYGIAYTIPASQRRSYVTSDKTKAVNISVSYDSSELLQLVDEKSVEEEAARNKTIETVRMLAKTADPSGIARLFLGIGECLSPTELAQLENQLTGVNREV